MQTDIKTDIINSLLREAQQLIDFDVFEYPPQYDIGWYCPDMEERILPALRASPGAQAMESIYYLIWIKFACNKNNRYKKALLAGVCPMFLSLVGEAAALIDFDVIIGGMNDLIPKYFREYFLRLKLGVENKSFSPMFVWDEACNSPVLYIGGRLLRSAEDICVKLRSIDAYGGRLIIEGFFSPGILLEHGGSLYARCRGEEFLLAETRAYSETSHFGIVLLKEYTFRFEVSDEDLRAGDSIGFVLRAGDRYLNCPVRFIRPQAKLASYPHASYTLIGRGRMLRYDSGACLITVHTAGRLSIFIRELRYAAALFGSKTKISRKFLYLFLRLLYFAVSPFFKRKEIWVYYDKLYKAGDNADYLFRYAAAQKDGILHRYILNGDAPEYAGMKKTYGRQILRFRSLRHIVTSLHAANILATHSNALGFLGLSPPMRSYFANIIHARVSCIQHGLTIQYMPEYQARFIDNTQLYFCASKYEADNLMLPAYDYEQGMIKLTGSPRYDGLNTERIYAETNSYLCDRHRCTILLAPTWRRELTIDNNRIGTKKGNSPHFKKTSFFRVYNDLLNNEKLNSLLDAEGAILNFLLHPTICGQADDFQQSDNIKIIAADEESYEELIGEADLFITDYSGVQFDFAYTAKPIIYFHSDEIPPAYESGFFDYDRMGFGPITKSTDELIKQLELAFAADFAAKDEYRCRADDFFVHRDKENCRRVYEELLR
jgi:hypothetical protein